MFKNEVIDKYLHCFMQNKNKMHRLAYTILGHCEELTFFEGKLGRFLGGV